MLIFGETAAWAVFLFALIMLRCVCPFMALSGQFGRTRVCPLLDKSGQRWGYARLRFVGLGHDIFLEGRQLVFIDFIFLRLFGRRHMERPKSRRNMKSMK